MKLTPLYGEHKKLVARFGAFGGWYMPISYEGILAEHKACRESAAVFDICHMGEFLFKGEAAELDKAVTQNVSGLGEGKSRYGFLLNDKGGITDDLIIFRISEDEFMIVVNAATAGNDYEALKKLLRKGELSDVSGETAKIDIQGPLSRDVLKGTLGIDVGLKYFNFGHFDVLGERALISRTGYTGELGYEIFINSVKAVELWNRLLGDGRVRPAGLGARDILRLEMGYSLYGNDIDERTTPDEAGLDMFVNYDKDFFGKKELVSLKEQGMRKTKIAFKTEGRRSPRSHYRILREGKDIGGVTSGVFSPVLSCGIGLGFVKPGAVKDGDGITISDGKRVELKGKITEVPFLKDTSLRS
ncbi:MAG: glycine cleavage system aminomethyltransferase GcvT [Elusimicrobiota bacterium]|nr:glycine cleavage system aminomethyltransferase GcvT [Elusimicrobiota bacterium]